MKVEMRVQGLVLTEGLRLLAEKQLHYALDWARYEVTKVILQFSDLNGPRGGNDKRCQLRIPLAGMREIVIEETGADLGIAVSRAIDRASRTLERRLSRRREFGAISVAWKEI